MANVSGKVVVITGASSGFGKGAARQLAQQGASVVLAARREELLQELVGECEAVGGKAVAAPIDVSKPADMDQLFAKAVAAFGKIDVWVNNAGAGALGRYEEIPFDDHVQVIQTDLLGTMYGSYLALKHFREQGQGILINVASVLGKIPAPYFASYVAAKHGIVGLDAALRQELTENNVTNVHVCTVMPTSMDTPFFEHAANHTGHQVTPIPPVYDPQEVIDTIVRLAAEPEDSVTVGTAGKLFNVAHHLMPGIVNAMMGKQTHREQMEKAPAAPDSPGSLHEPAMTGTDVSGGWKK